MTVVWLALGGAIIWAPSVYAAESSQSPRTPDCLKSMTALMAAIEKTEKVGKECDVGVKLRAAKTLCKGEQDQGTFAHLEKMRADRGAERDCGKTPIPNPRTPDCLKSMTALMAAMEKTEKMGQANAARLNQGGGTAAEGWKMAEDMDAQECDVGVKLRAAKTLCKGEQDQGTFAHLEKMRADRGAERDCWKTPIPMPPELR